MSSLNPKGGLAIAEIVFFAPALVVSGYIVFRHGFARQMGWVYLVILSILRIVGASSIVYAETKHDYSTGLLETAAITSAIGTAPLLLTLLGFLARLHNGMKSAGANLPDLLFRGISLLSTAGLVLGIVGGTYKADPTQASTYKTGADLMEAASVIFLVVYLILAGITVLTFTRKHAIVSTERKLIDAALAALPFLLVRVVYTVCVAFSNNPSSIFFYNNVDVYASAFMQFLMEALAVIIFIVAGLMTPRKSPVNQRDTELSSERSSDGGHIMESGRVPQQQPQYEGMPSKKYQQQQPRSIGDYRPSKLIRNALSGR